MRSRLSRTLTFASVLIVALSTMALATDHDEAAVEVQTTVGEEGSRQLRVYELVGTDLLTNLSLTPGAPSPFRVEVEDLELTGPVLGGDFDVASVLNNLYLDGDATADSIPSGDVTVDYATTAVDSLTEQLDVALKLVVGSSTTIGCGDLVGLDVLATTACDLLLGGGITVEDIPVVGNVVEDIDLTGLDPADLLVALPTGLQETGAYTDPDFSDGTIGENHPDIPGGWTATTKRYLAGRPLLSEDLLDAIGDAIDGVPLVPDLVEQSTLLGALQQEGGTAATLLQALNLLGVDIQATLNGVFDVVELDPALAVADLRLTARHMAFPRLTVAPTGEPAPGDYRGTLTVTLFDF